MAMKLGLTFLILFHSVFSLFFISQLAQSSDDPSGDINYWCSTTPHPEQCRIFMGGSHRFIPKHRADFRTMAVQVAVERAHQAHTHAKNVGPKCRSKHAKLAWMDCSKLLEDTVFQLNRTLHGLRTNLTSCNDYDAQTWLSAALTSVETCRTGSVELNVSHFINPLISNNVSELISNSLAINGMFLDHLQHTDGGYPSWLSEGERKLLQSSSSSLASKANVVVAKDGSGRFKSIQAGINYAVSKRKAGERVIVYVRRGVYKENIELGNNMDKVTLVGEGLRYTIITGSRSGSTGFTTYSSATVGVNGAGFMARGITFRNTAGPQAGQAVALRSASDLGVFFACSFEGYQDTIFALAQRQFFKSCYIYGTIDFIFGNAAVVFQSCNIYVRKPLKGQVNVITAQGRGDPFQNTGISIHSCRVLPAPDLKPVAGSFQTYLGRPWQQYSRTVFLKSYLDGIVDPAGWLPWDNSNFAQNTLYYGEYMNFGPAASTEQRVKWKGYHVLTDPKIASQFTVTKLIAGRAWLPATGVPFTAGL